MGIRQSLRYRHLRSRALAEAMDAGYRLSPQAVTIIELVCRQQAARETARRRREPLAELVNLDRVRPSERALAARAAWIAANGGYDTIRRRIAAGPLD